MREVNERLGWHGLLSDFGSVRILRNRFTVVWRDGGPGSGRIVVATRDDDTSVILKWFAMEEKAAIQSWCGFGSA